MSDEVKQATAEAINNAIQALNELMQDNGIAQNDKQVIKINRFKKWLLLLQTI